jgi:hypothetical protein
MTASHSEKDGANQRRLFLFPATIAAPVFRPAWSVASVVEVSDAFPSLPPV